MAVVLRLTRLGKHKSPVYRIVAADKAAKRDGRFLEVIGTYNTLTSGNRHEHSASLFGKTFHPWPSHDRLSRVDYFDWTWDRRADTRRSVSAQPQGVRQPMA